MRTTRTVMGMDGVIEITRAADAARLTDAAFAICDAANARFSMYQRDSEASRLNRGEITLDEISAEMRAVLAYGEAARTLSGGYFDIETPRGEIDPTGVVKGCALQQMVELLQSEGVTDYYVEIGGDLAVSGTDSRGRPWRIGIENPFNRSEIIAVLEPGSRGVATSGTAARGAHIYTPQTGAPPTGVASITVVAPNIAAADVMATAAFAMGRAGVAFIESLPDFEAYLVDDRGRTTMTSGLLAHTI